MTDTKTDAAGHHEPFYQGKRALVTGGLGFVGSNLVRRLVDLGAIVSIVDALTPETGANRFNLSGYEDRVALHEVSTADLAQMRVRVQAQDLLFNLAGQVSHIDSMTHPLADLAANAAGPLTVLEACRQTNPTIKVVYAGTRQQYGKPVYLPLDEHHPQQPTDVNGVNKIAGEWYHRVYHNAYGLRTTSLRMTNTYGPRQLMRHNRQGFISWFVRTVIEGGEIQLYGDGRQRRDLCFVDDAVDAFLRAGAADSADGEFYNLGGSEPIQLLDLANLLIELAGQGSVRLAPWPEARKRIDIGDVYSSYAKIESELGWQPATSLREGLSTMIAYYREHQRHYW